MKTIKYLSIVFALILAVSACKLPDNIDPKNPTEVPIPTIFTNAQIALVNHVDDVNVNTNTTRLIVQYWQQTTYFDESRYLFQDRQIPDGYTIALYRDALMDLKRAKELLSDPAYGGNAIQTANEVAVIEILEAYAWHVVVDAFGNMPYSQALLGAENSQPAYDDAASIYSDQINSLKAALTTLNSSKPAFGVADVMYNGDVDAWKKFGASLLLRMGMRLSDVNSTESVSAVNAAIAAGVFTSQDESGFLYYPGVVPHVNQIYDAYTVQGRADYLPTNTIIDMMKDYNDPRLPLWFTQVDGEYIGAVAGLDGAQTYSNFSNFSDRFFAPTFEANIIDYVEVEFLLAEAAQRGGYNVSGSAEDHYNTAITESILYWGGTSDDATTYLAGVPYNASAWKESIGTQKWIALYNRGVEGWAEWRRLDYPELNVPEGMSYGDIPKRMPYPYDESKQNKSNYNAAVGTLELGVDDQRSKVFWDVNNPSFQ
jgi:hypothetical protein